MEDTQLAAAAVIRAIHRDEDGEGDKGSSATQGRAQTLPPPLLSYHVTAADNLEAVEKSPAHLSTSGSSLSSIVTCN